MTTQNTLPNPEEALGLIHDQVHARAFFAKLASEGFVPQTEEEAATYLRLGAQLRNSGYSEKAAQVRQEKQASASLPARVLAGMTRQPADVSPFAVKQAATALAQDPSIFNAALTLCGVQQQLLEAAAQA